MPPITKRRASKKKTFRRNKSAKRSGSRSRPTGKTRTRNRTNRKIRLQRKKRRSMTKKRSGGFSNPFAKKKSLTEATGLTEKERDAVEKRKEAFKNELNCGVDKMYKLYQNKKDDPSFLMNHFGSNHSNPIDSSKLGDKESFEKLLPQFEKDACSMGEMNEKNKEATINNALEMRRIAAAIPYSSLPSGKKSLMALWNKDKYKMVQHTYTYKEKDGEIDVEKKITKLYLYNAVAGTLYKNSEEGIAEQIIKSCHDKAFKEELVEKVDIGLGAIGGEGLAKTLRLAHYIIQKISPDKKNNFEKEKYEAPPEKEKVVENAIKN